MKKIEASAQSIRELLGGKKFAIDYYQREYRWERKQIQELINDLVQKFDESYDERGERTDTEGYSHYFLGSIIVSERDGQRFVIDGQQRLTSITLLLIYIYHQLNDDDEKTQIAELIFSKKRGVRSFNLNFPERAPCMEALYKDGSFSDNDPPESVANIVARYQDIEDVFPDDLTGKALLYFMDWLIENVHFVEITTNSDSDAYTIFETMNDRGLHLTPTEMLKGYLLANIKDINLRNEANETWRDRIAKLQQLGKEEDADAVKAWLRSQHAKSIRKRERGAEPLDFDLIGTVFHRWVQKNKDSLRLKAEPEFNRFIQNDFKFYSQCYEKIQNAAKKLTGGLEAIYYNAQSNFTLQFPVLLAPLQQSDDPHEIDRKLQIVASYLDIIIARRIWNGSAIGYSTMQYAMFLVILDIRGKSSNELINILIKRLNEDEHSFPSNDLCLHHRNYYKIRCLLARIIDYIETGSGRASRYEEYIQRGSRSAYEIEHIWAKHPELHEDEFPHSSDFLKYRDRIGGLLLIPKSFNASYGAKPYTEKLEHYYSHNLLAQSLHEKAYKNDPGFNKFREESGLNFRPHTQFKKADLDDRQELYRQIAKHIWNPDILKADR